MLSFVYILLALLALGVLILIHELGHFLMARKVGMRVEVFSIGLGQAIYSWEYDGVKWQIGWIPLGGYVRFAGQETEDSDVDLHDIPDGFFGKTPWDRIKVAFMGPFVNIAFAFLIFSAIWFTGGRDKRFQEYSRTIGWVDPQSELFAQGVRPGDELSSYDEHVFKGFKDHFYAAMLSDETVNVKGIKHSYESGKAAPFDLDVKVYKHPYYRDDIQTAGILHSASYLNYSRKQSQISSEGALNLKQPLGETSIQENDRIVWADGEYLFSIQQLSQLVNDNRVLATVERDGKRFLARVPRLPTTEFKLNAEVKEEFHDWQYEKVIPGKFDELYTIPYNISYDCVVESKLTFIDKDSYDANFPKKRFSEKERALLPGDRILAINGTSVRTGADLLEKVQTRKVHFIVERNSEQHGTINWKEADAAYSPHKFSKDIETIALGLGTDSAVLNSGNIHLLEPVEPKTLRQIYRESNKEIEYAAMVLEARQSIEELEDSEKKTRSIQAMKEQESKLYIGFNPSDRTVEYNPLPQTQTWNLVLETKRFLTSLVSGYVSPNMVSGPVAMVQVMSYGWSLGLTEAMFWVALISLNLGIFNLFPIPPLDGGHICFALWEMITRKRIQAKTMERLVLPFIVLFIGVFLYVSFHDVQRIIRMFF